MNASRIELLQRMPIFGGIADETLAFLVDQAATRQVARGGEFFREGDEAQAMFVLESGRVDIVRSWQGDNLVLRQLGAGDCFGEMALLDLFPRSATVRALEDCVAIELSSADLYRLYGHDVAQFALIQMNIAREMSRRLRRTDEDWFQARMRGQVPGGGTVDWHST